jgi:hypothetical protein
VQRAARLAAIGEARPRDGAPQFRFHVSASSRTSASTAGPSARIRQAGDRRAGPATASRRGLSAHRTRAGARAAHRARRRQGDGRCSRRAADPPTWAGARRARGGRPTGRSARARRRGRRHRARDRRERRAGGAPHRPGPRSRPRRPRRHGQRSFPGGLERHSRAPRSLASVLSTASARSLPADPSYPTPTRCRVVVGADHPAGATATGASLSTSTVSSPAKTRPGLSCLVVPTTSRSAWWSVANRCRPRRTEPSSSVLRDHRTCDARSRSRRGRCGHD